MRKVYNDMNDSHHLNKHSFLSERKKYINVIYIILFSVLLVLLYLVFPKEPVNRKSHEQYSGLVFSEAMSANSVAVPDENGEFCDWLEIYNGTGADLDLEGIMLTNRSDRITFYFPSYILAAGERVIVFCSDSYQVAPSQPFHGKFKLSSAGSHVYMYDPDMQLIDDMAIPTMSANCSYILVGIDENGQKKYEVTDYYSPGYENTHAGFCHTVQSLWQKAAF